MIISHVRQIDGAVQSNEVHQREVATLASSFANGFGCAELAQVIGLLHDKGKEQLESLYSRGDGL